MRYIISVSALLALSAVGFGQQSFNETLVKHQRHFSPLKQVRVPKLNISRPIAMARTDDLGRRVTGWTPIRYKTRVRTSVTTWQVAFDAMDTDVATMNPFAGAYGTSSAGTGSVWVNSPIYHSPGELLDIYLNPGGTTGPDTHGRLAQNVRLLWQAGGASFTPVITLRCVGTFGTLDAGPAFANRKGGVAFQFAPVTAGFQFPEIDFSAFTSGPNTVRGLELPADDTGGFLYAISALDGTGNIIPIPEGSTANPYANNMMSPGEPLYPGTNPSGSSDLNWDDDNPPDYLFQDETNTASPGPAYSELYSWSYGAGFGVLQPTVALFVDPAARLIKGQLVLNGYSPTPLTRPNGFGYKLYQGTTLVDEGFAPIGDDFRYIIPDPNPSTPGVYTLIAQTHKYVAKKFTVDTSTGTTIPLDVVLPFTGDITRDGVVNLNDFSILSIAYGRRYTDASWTTSIQTSYTAVDADLTMDGSVNLNDFSLLSIGYGRRNDTP